MRMLNPSILFICFYVAQSSVANPLSQRAYLPQPVLSYQDTYVLPPEIALALQQSTSNNCPCTHHAVTKNQIPQSYYDSKNFPENSYNLDKLLLDNVLSNPVLTTILNPENDLYQNGGLYQKQLSSLPQMNNVPNVINNYIIIPSEYSKVNKSSEQGEIVNRIQKVTDKCNPKVKSRSDEDQFKIINADNRHTELRNGNPSLNLRRKQRMFESEINPKIVNNSNPGDKSFKKRRKDKPEEEDRKGKASHILVEGHQSINMLTGDTNENIRTSRLAETKTGNQATANKHVELNNGLSNHFINTNNDTVSGFKLNQMQPELDIAKESTKSKRKHNLRSENRVVRNSKEEEVVHLMHEKFPDIPEELIRNLISHLKKQFEKNNENFFHKFYSNYQFPLTYDQIFPQFYNFANSLSPERSQNSVKKRRQRLNRRNQNRKRKNDSTKNSTLTERVRINIDGLTDIDSIPIENITETPVLQEQKQEFSKQSSKHLKDGEQLLDLRIKVPDIDSEDTVPVFFSNGLVDDYYPDFRSENKAHLNSIEEFSATDLRENRYVYTTDKNTGIENINNDNRKSQYKFNGYSNNKKAVSNDFDTKEPTEFFENVNEKVDIIQFLTPLVLENPDFRTKQINKDPETAIERTLVDEAINKVSTYSDMKSPTYYANGKQSNGIEYDERVRKNQSFRSFDNIETIYGNSKVVKYGPTSEHDVEEVTTAKYDMGEKKRNGKGLNSNNGETMIVLAKSLGYW